MNSYLVETDDFTAPINYNVLVGGIRSKYGHGQYQKRYFHIIVTSGSMVIASTNPAISKTYPSQDIIAYYKQKTLKDLRIFTFGKYKYKTYLEVIKSDPWYVNGVSRTYKILVSLQMSILILVTGIVII